MQTYTERLEYYSKGRSAMIFQWFDANEAEKIACDLADQFAPRSAGTSDAATGNNDDAALRDLIRLVQTDARLSSLNFYKKAKFANSFKWRLLEKGIERNTANHVTTSLVVHLTRGPQTVEPSAVAAEGGAAKKPDNIPDLLRLGNKAFTDGEYEEAVKVLESAIDRSRPHPEF